MQGGPGGLQVPPAGCRGRRPLQRTVRPPFGQSPQADHLGSTSITANSSGTKVAELRYKAWGETRYTWGTTPTTYRYTGQREQAEIGLYYYGARWYDPYISRFTQPDTIVPGAGDPQSWNRFSYVGNNPLAYSDPSGHDREQIMEEKSHV